MIFILKRFRKYAEMMFDSVCNIYEYKEIVVDNISHRELNIVLSSVPCRVSYATTKSYNRANTAKQTIDNSEIEQAVKLFCPADTEITPGSYINVIRDNSNEFYEYTGKMMKYKTHVELLMKSVDIVA